MLRIGIAASLVAWATLCSAQGEDRYRQFEILLKQQRYDRILARMAPERIAKGQPLPGEVIASDVAWLRTKADEGHPPLLYVLAFRLSDADPPESLRWYGRGRIFALLDGGECIGIRFPWSAVLEGAFPELDQLRNRYPQRYFEAVDEALKVEQGRSSRPPSTWLCDAGVHPPQIRSQKRTERFNSLLKANNERLASGRDNR